MVTHQEPNILEGVVNWALGSIIMNKAIGVLEFLLTYFKSYSYRRNKCYSALFNILANLDNSAMVTRLENVSFHSSSKEEQCLRMFKLPYNSTLFMC